MESRPPKWAIHNLLRRQGVARCVPSLRLRGVTEKVQSSIAPRAHLVGARRPTGPESWALIAPGPPRSFPPDHQPLSHDRRRRPSDSSLSDEKPNALAPDRRSKSL